MPDNQTPDTRNTNSTEMRFRRFESAWLNWRDGEPMPDWRRHLPVDEEPCNPAFIAALLELDIERRIKVGLPALLCECYFEHPRLQREDARLDAARQIALIRFDYQQRWQNGERARRGEYQSAFPQYADVLSELKPSSVCPRCQRRIELDEMVGTIHCPHCDTAGSLPTTMPPFPAPLTHPADDSCRLDLRGYELLETLGQGGMGEVYRCGDPALGRDLAIKVIKDDYRGEPEVERRFLREARITGSLQHPGIVPIHNLGRLADGRLHYTMRLVRGRTFADILKDEAGQPERRPELLTIFVKICQAVAYAHSKRVIHRDLKPNNVMVGRFGEVQVMDWGLAKLLSPGERGGVSAPTLARRASEGQPNSRWRVGLTPSADEDEGTRIHTESADASSELTQMGSGIGTPPYMSVEQALGAWERVDERADVFALGSILCEILTGNPAYVGRTRNEVLSCVRRGDISDASARLDKCGADAALTTLCHECLSPEREARPRDAGVVSQRVSDYQAEVQARLQRAEVERARAVVKAQEEHKRRRVILASMLLLLTAALLAIWQAVRATDEKRNAQRAADSEREARQAETQQRETAEANERQAEQAKKDAEAVLGFFQNKVLAANRPEGQAGGQGTDVKLSEAVDKAEPEIVKEFTDRPLVEAAIRDTLGSTYLYLGKAALAIGQHERALALRQAKLGPDHSDTLTSTNNLAVAYQAAGRVDKALPLLEQTLDKRKAMLGPDHPNTLVGMSNLAVAYQAAGRADKALPLLEQTLDKIKAQYGADHPNALKTMSSLAVVYWVAGQRDKALTLFEQTAAKQKTKLGADHPDTLKSIDILAGAYRAVGRMDMALPLFEQTLAKRKAKLGADHPDTLASMNSLALAYRSVGQRAKARLLFEQTLDKRKAKLGADHPDTLQSMGNLAQAYQNAGQLDKALPLFQQTLDKRKTKLGPDHPDTLVSMNNLAMAYRSAGKLDRSVPLLEEALKLRKAKFGVDHPDTLVVTASLGVLYRDAGRLSEAIRLLESALQRGRLRRGGLPASLAEATRELAQTYERVEQFAKAEPLYRESLQQAHKRFGPNDLRTAAAMAPLAANLLKQKKFADAEPLLLQVYEGMKQRQDKISPSAQQLRLREALARLVQLYDAWGKKDDAAKWRKELDAQGIGKK